MGLAFRVMLWVFMFNIAVGLIFWAGTGVGAGSREWRITGTNVNAYSQQTSELNTQFNSSTTIPAQSQNTLWYRFLDMISLGLFSIIQNVLYSTVYAIPASLTSMGLIPSSMQVFLIAILTVIYIVGVFELFSNKDLTLR